MALISYVDDVETVTLPEMEDRLRTVLKYMLFLSDHALFTPIEMKQNNVTFLWYLRMPKVLEDHRQLVDVKMEEFQALLATRIKKFVEDLELYAKMVDELQHNGDIEDLARYHKKATQLDNRLTPA
jgi:dynein heavy chain